jgi:hypothetical protein
MKSALQGAFAAYSMYQMYCLSQGKEPEIRSLDEMLDRDTVLNVAEEIVTVEAIDTAYQQAEKLFPKYLTQAAEFAKFLTPFEAFKLLKEMIECIILNLEDHPDEHQKALANLNILYWEKVKYIGTGAAIGGGIGFGLARLFAKSNTLLSILTMAGLGAVVSGFVFSHKYRVQLEELYKALEIDLSSFFYMIAKDNKKLLEFRILQRGVTKVVNFVGRHIRSADD